MQYVEIVYSPHSYWPACALALPLGTLLKSKFVLTPSVVISRRLHDKNKK